MINRKSNGFPFYLDIALLALYIAILNKETPWKKTFPNQAFSQALYKLHKSTNFSVQQPDSICFLIGSTGVKLMIGFLSNEK